MQLVKEENIWIPSNHPDDGGSKHLWNAGQLLWDYKDKYSRRLSAYIYTETT
jgi:hypothetical protein